MYICVLAYTHEWKYGCGDVNALHGCTYAYTYTCIRVRMMYVLSLSVCTFSKKNPLTRFNCSSNIFTKLRSASAANNAAATDGRISVGNVESAVASNAEREVVTSRIRRFRV